MKFTNNLETEFLNWSIIFDIAQIKSNLWKCLN